MEEQIIIQGHIKLLLTQTLWASLQFFISSFIFYCILLLSYLSEDSHQVSLFPFA